MVTSSPLSPITSAAQQLTLEFLDQALAKAGSAMAHGAPEARELLKEVDHRIRETDFRKSERIPMSEFALGLLEQAVRGTRFSPAQMFNSAEQFGPLVQARIALPRIELALVRGVFQALEITSRQADTPFPVFNAANALEQTTWQREPSDNRALDDIRSGRWTDVVEQARLEARFDNPDGFRYEIEEIARQFTGDEGFVHKVLNSPHMDRLSRNLRAVALLNVDAPVEELVAHMSVWAHDTRPRDPAAVMAGALEDIGAEEASKALPFAGESLDGLNSALQQQVFQESLNREPARLVVDRGPDR